MRAETCETWIIVETWWMKPISRITATTPSALATVTVSRGTNCSTPPTARRPIRQKTKMPTKTPTVACVIRSPRKFGSTRGLNWLDASCSTTIVTEKVRPATVISEPAIVSKTVRAALALPPKTHGVAWPITFASRRTSANESAPSATTISEGTNQSPSTSDLQCARTSRPMRSACPGGSGWKRAPKPS